MIGVKSCIVMYGKEKNPGSLDVMCSLGDVWDVISCVVVGAGARAPAVTDATLCYVEVVDPVYRESKGLGTCFWRWCWVQVGYR